MPTPRSAGGPGKGSQQEYKERRMHLSIIVVHPVSVSDRLSYLEWSSLQFLSHVLEK